MPFAAVGVEVLGSETTGTDLRTAVTMLFAAVRVEVLGSETKDLWLGAAWVKSQAERPSVSEVN